MADRCSAGTSAGGGAANALDVALLAAFRRIRPVFGKGH
jgi:hypothetical protein